MTDARLTRTLLLALCCWVVGVDRVDAQAPGVRRDPFVPLISSSPTHSDASAPPPAGRRRVVADVPIAALTLTGTLRGTTRRLALVTDTTGHTWVVAEGSRLKDGIVRRVGERDVEVVGMSGVGGVVLTLGRTK